MIRSTSSPAIFPASLVACRWASLKYAGTVITASVTRSPSDLPASSASLRSTCALISSGAYCLPRTSKRADAARSLDHVERDRLGLVGHLVELAADEALRGVDGALRVEDRLAAGELPDQPFAVFGERRPPTGSSGRPRRWG